MRLFQCKNILRGQRERRMNKKRIRLGILGLALGLAVIFPVGGRIKAAMTVVEVKKAGQVVDSFQGVNAVYRPGKWDGDDKIYSCAALVKKYYQARYGFTPYNLFAGATPLEYDKGGKFKKVTSPKVGDIASKSTHWAIVQNVSGNNVTLLEQNWKRVVGKKTYAKSDRVVSKSEMKYFRYYDKNGKEVLNGSSSSSSSVSKPRTLSINRTSLNVKTRATATLTATIGNKRSGDTVTFSSSNKKIATVSSRGVITGVKTGTCYVTATVKGTNLSKKCKVSVSLGSRSIKLNASRLTLIKVKSYPLKGVIYNKRSNDKLKYKTSNKKIATVSSKGVVKKKKKKGTATITAWIPGTSTKKTCRVTVK
jgi:uncharacterized protein YjdB